MARAKPFLADIAYTATERLFAHSAWLNAATPAGQNLRGEVDHDAV
jgi:hypothetical protein